LSLFVTRPFGRAVDGAQRAGRLAERLRPRGGPMQPRVAEAAALVIVTPLVCERFAGSRHHWKGRPVSETSNREAPVLIVWVNQQGPVRHEGRWESDDAGRLIIQGAEGRMIAMYAPAAWLSVRDASADVARERKALELAKQALGNIKSRSGRERVIQNMAEEALHDIADIEEQA
jgi:hypothetical protein